MKPRPSLVATTAPLTVAAVALVLVLTGCSQTSHNGIDATPGHTVIAVADRMTAGKLHGELLSGGSYSLSQDLGHVIVLNFFASWCPPCQAETPQFDALYRQLEPAGVRFIGLDVKDGSQSGSRDWLAAKQVTFPVVWDQPAKTAVEIGHLALPGLPETVIVDAHGRVAAVYPGPRQPADLMPALGQLAKEA